MVVFRFKGHTTIIVVRTGMVNGVSMSGKGMDKLPRATIDQQYAR